MYTGKSNSPHRTREAMAGQKERAWQRRFVEGAARWQKHGRDRMRPFGRFFLLRKRIARHSRPIGRRVPIQASLPIGAYPVRSSPMKALRSIKASDGTRGANREETDESCAQVPPLVSLAATLAMNSLLIKMGNLNFPEPVRFRAAAIFFTAGVSHKRGCARKWQALRMHPT